MTKQHKQQQTKRQQSKLDLFLEFLLKEDVPPPESSQDFDTPQPEKNISLDQTVDRYLIRYEQESIPINDMYESLFRKKSFMLEQLEDDLGDEEEVVDDDDAGDLGGDLGDLGGVDDGLGGDAGGEDEAAKPVLSTPKINLNDFARSVARLVNNFQALLDPKSTILNRVEAYITNNYDAKTANELMQTLETNYSLKPTDVDNTTHQGDSQFPQPYAVGATSSGGGG
jgi:hypothetical protein